MLRANEEIRSQPDRGNRHRVFCADSQRLNGSSDRTTSSDRGAEVRHPVCAKVLERYADSVGKGFHGAIGRHNTFSPDLSALGIYFLLRLPVLEEGHRH